MVNINSEERDRLRQAELCPRNTMMSNTGVIANSSEVLPPRPPPPPPQPASKVMGKNRIGNKFYDLFEDF